MKYVWMYSKSAASCNDEAERTSRHIQHFVELTHAHIDMSASVPQLKALGVANTNSVYNCHLVWVSSSLRWQAIKRRPLPWKLQHSSSQSSSNVGNNNNSNRCTTTSSIFTGCRRLILPIIAHQFVYNGVLSTPSDLDASYLDPKPHRVARSTGQRFKGESSGLPHHRTL